MRHDHRHSAGMRRDAHPSERPEQPNQAQPAAGGLERVQAGQGPCGVWECPMGRAPGWAPALTTPAPSHLFYLLSSQKPHHLKTGSPYFKNTNGEKHWFMSASQQGLSRPLGQDSSWSFRAGLGAARARHPWPLPLNASCQPQSP